MQKQKWGLLQLMSRKKKQPGFMVAEAVMSAASKTQYVQINNF